MADYNYWCKQVISTQTPCGGFQCILFIPCLLGIIGALERYHANDRLTFNCIPKPSDFTKQLCYNNYISTVSKEGLIPQNVAAITFGVVCVCWIGFTIYGIVALRKIRREQTDQDFRQRQWRKFFWFYFTHVCFRILFLGFMLGLFCSHQTINLPEVFKCHVPQISQTNMNPFNQTKRTLQCNDLHYKEKTNLNFAIIAVHASFMMFSIWEVLHLLITREKFKEKLLGDALNVDLAFENLLSSK